MYRSPQKRENHNRAGEEGRTGARLSNKPSERTWPGRFKRRFGRFTCWPGQATAIGLRELLASVRPS